MTSDHADDEDEMLAKCDCSLAIANAMGHNHQFDYRVSVWLRAPYIEYPPLTGILNADPVQFDLYFFGCNYQYKYNFTGYAGMNATTNGSNGVMSTGKTYYYMRDNLYYSQGWKYYEMMVRMSHTSIRFISTRIDVNTTSNGSTFPAIDIAHWKIEPINVSLKSYNIDAYSGGFPGSPTNAGGQVSLEDIEANVYEQ